MSSNTIAGLRLHGARGPACGLRRADRLGAPTTPSRAFFCPGAPPLVEPEGSQRARVLGSTRKRIEPLNRGPRVLSEHESSAPAQREARTVSLGGERVGQCGGNQAQGQGDEEQTHGSSRQDTRPQGGQHAWGPGESY